MIKVLSSSPNNPLSARFKQLSSEADEVIVASAFLSKDALAALEQSARHDCRIKVLTGTFGHHTRQDTFRWLLNKCGGGSWTVKIWACTTHGNFHGKVYLWRLSKGRAVAWVGSANMTNGGLQNEGELVAEITGKSTSAAIQRVAKALNREWNRSEHIDQRFVDDYVESPRVPPDSRVSRGVSTRDHRPDGFILTIYHHYADTSPVLKRVDVLLSGSADGWYRGRGTFMSALKEGARCILFDTVDNTVGEIVITQVAKDGTARLISYDTTRRRVPWRPITRELRAKMQGLGLRTSKRGFRVQALSSSQLEAAREIIYA